jgi:hypothetical protein
VAVVGALVGSLFLGCGSILGIEVVPVDSGRIIASHVVPPYRIVSDGTTLFWTTLRSSPGLLSMPVGGGTIRTVLTAQTTTSDGGAFLAVDDVNVYVLARTETDGCVAYSLMRIPKNGGATTFVNDTPISAATSLGATAYWCEAVDPLCGQPPPNAGFKSGPLAEDAGAVTLFASTCFFNSLIPSLMAVTPNAIVYATSFGAFYCPAVNGTSVMLPSLPVCTYLTSDTNAIYCASGTGSNLRIASDGTVLYLGTADQPSYIVFDDTYVYWADSTPAPGAIKRAPKAGSKDPVLATVLALDANPTAVGIDANFIYWGDKAGYIKRIPK